MKFNLYLIRQSFFIWALSSLYRGLLGITLTVPLNIKITSTNLIFGEHTFYLKTLIQKLTYFFLTGVSLNIFKTNNNRVKKFILFKLLTFKSLFVKDEYKIRNLKNKNNFETNLFLFRYWVKTRQI